MKQNKQFLITILLTIILGFLIANTLSKPLLASVACANGKCMCVCHGESCGCLNNYPDYCFCYCASTGEKQKCDKSSDSGGGHQGGGGNASPN